MTNFPNCNRRATKDERTVFKAVCLTSKSEGAPVLIAAGALLKDNEIGKVLAQLKIQNISGKPIKAATVKLAPADTTGKPLGDEIQHQYLDLNAGRDADF